MMRRWSIPALLRQAVLLVVVLLSAAVPLGAAETGAEPAPGSTDVGKESATASPRKPSRRIKAESEQAKRLVAARKKAGSGSAYRTWKRRLPFWPRKGFIMVELTLFIALGVLLGQALEVSGALRVIAVIALPLARLGRLPNASGGPFLMAFQSGAVANGMLASYRDEGSLTKGQFYASVLVVSCISLFAHLPTFVVPLGMAFGWAATGAFFGVRFGAIVIEITLILLVSRLLQRSSPTESVGGRPRPEEGRRDVATTHSPTPAPRVGTGPFWRRVWKRSRKTLTRLLICVVPTFAVMATLEYMEFFGWLSQRVPGLFSLKFLPPEAPVVIAAQAVSLHNGALAAANLTGDGAITVQQSVIILLFGSVLTAPFRTVRHALPTYIAILGPRTGLALAVTAQVLRCFFVSLCTVVLMLFWS
jgi:hypothetical protein